MAFTHHAGANLHWKFDGFEDAPALVLLNSIGTDMDLWDAVLPILRKSFAVLRIDTRGHGASAATRGDYSLGGLADDVFAIMSAAGFASAAVAGVSLGGMIAMEMAMMQPTKVSSLVLACTSATMDSSAWNDRVALVREQGMASIADLVMGRFLSPGFVEKKPEVAATIRRRLLGMDADGYAGCGAAIRDMALSRRLSEITCPTLVVTGNLDTSTPLIGHGDFLLEHLVDPRHVAVDAAHLAPLEAPDALAGALIAFVQEG